MKESMAPLETKPDTELGMKLRFVKFLNEISTFFINLPIDRIDSEIEIAQSRVCKFLDLDRSTLFQISGKNSPIIQTHVYQPPGSRMPPEQINLLDLFPWVFQKVLAGETITISKMRDLRAEASRDREMFYLYGTRSVVIVPLSVKKGKIFGLLTFAVTREEREWPETVVQEFKTVAQIFANALARKQADQVLRESEARLNMVTEIAGAGLWIMEIDAGCVWGTPKTRELFHFAPDEELTHENFIKVIHPDDHEQVQQDMQKALRSGEDLKCEYRIVLPDGKPRWILACGKRHFSPSGKPERLMGVSLDITERKLAEQALEERLRFEMLLTEISTRFVNQPVDRIDREIEDAQGRICKLLDLDISALWQWSDETCNLLMPTHVYNTQEGAQPSEGMTQENFPWCRQQMLDGRIISVSSLEELPPEAACDRESCRLFGIKSSLTFPLLMGDNPPVGVLGFNALQAERDWPKELVTRLQLVAQIFTNALERKRMDTQLRDQLRKIENLKQNFEQENICLKKEVKHLRIHKEIVGQSEGMQKILNLSEQVAQTESTVIILGETGTGKGLLARVIHGMSSRKDRPLVTVNCAALPHALIEGELFGREKGAYTGALTKMVGRFEVADGATIFLDEIGELPHDVQSKLLQVLEEGRFERLGSTRSLHADVRIIAATNRDLPLDVKEGKFRKDLYYRLNVFPIPLPPLRERAEDIPLMVWAFVKEFQKKMGKKIESIPRKTLEALQCYHWPGNVRELRNVIEHAMILNKDANLVITMPGIASFETQAASHLNDVERRHIISMLKRTGWRVAGKGGAAEALGLKRTTLYSKMKKLGIDRPSVK
jgi:PAS domain S-box-containing protein